MEVSQQQGEVDGGGLGTGEPGTAFVGNHADDFAPGRRRVFAKTLAEGGGGRTPDFRRHVGGHQRHQALFVDILPGEVTASEKRRTHGGGAARRGEAVFAERGYGHFRVRPVFDDNRIRPACGGHGNGCSGGDYGDAGDRSYALQDVFLHLKRGIVTGDLGGRDGDAEGKDLLRVCEAGVHLAEGGKRSEHQTCSDGEQQSESHLENDQRSAQTVAFAGFGLGSASGMKTACEPGSGTAKGGQTAEEESAEQRDAERESQRQGIERGFVQTRDVGGGKRRENRQGSGSEGNTKSSAEEGENHALLQ